MSESPKKKDPDKPAASIFYRPLDLLIVVFFLFNILFVTYIIDLETLIIKNPSKYKYPVWPRPFMVNIIHWWGHNFDPLLLARPLWWKATVWIDVLLFGPFYCCAIYAFIRGLKWIRIPSLVYCGMMLSNLIIIMMEEMMGPYKSRKPGQVWVANLPWIVFPIIIIGKLAINWKNPFQ